MSDPENTPPAERHAGNPRIAIVGRPNGGKSTLTNRLAGRRVSITEPTAGVTRDRISVHATLRGDDGDRVVELVDTGGVGIVDRDDLGPHVEGQVRTALGIADLVLFLVDAREGVTPLDQTVAGFLRGVETPILLLANKAESEKIAWEVSSFYKLGIDCEPMAISAQNGIGLDELIERICELLPPPSEDEVRIEPTMKLAVVGRRNAGKSTLINAFAGTERVIVSEVPGTTRDAVDVIFERDGENFMVIDTAGVLKKKKMQDAVAFYSDARAHKAVRRADAVMLLFEAERPISALEKRLARFIVDLHKPLLLAANKWDLVDPNVNPTDFKDYLDKELPGVRYAPVSFLSAKNGDGVWDSLELCRELVRQSQTRISTGELNRVLDDALKARVPTSRAYRVKVYYATQVDVGPPTFVLWVNDRRLIGKEWLRFVENRLKEAFSFDEIPIQIIVKNRDRREASPF
jgi:GTP-binding protein